MLNEHDFIEKLKKLIPTYGKDVVMGIGDDAAVLQSRKGEYLLASCDVQVEGVHFTKGITPRKLAEKAILASVSDIAAMGGKPTSVLISLILPKWARMNQELFVDELYEGFRQACIAYNVSLIGGNISSGKQLIIDTFVLGKARQDEVLYRSGAKPGDLVLVTGTLGEQKMRCRVKEGLIIAKSKLATAMIDLSDGLSTDISHICDASRVGVRIFLDQLPITLKTSLDLALNGGEDYELCFTANKKNARNLANLLETRTKTRVSIIGEILSKKEWRWIVDEAGKKTQLIPRGWDHFV